MVFEISPFRYATVEMTSSMFRVRSEPTAHLLCHFERSETGSRNLLAFPTKHWPSDLTWFRDCPISLYYSRNDRVTPGARTNQQQTHPMSFRAEWNGVEKSPTFPTKSWNFCPI